LKLWKEIERAGDETGKVILRTPIIYSDTLSNLTGKEIFLKLENLQRVEREGIPSSAAWLIRNLDRNLNI